MCKANYNMVVIASGATSSGMPMRLEEPVQQLEEMHRAQELAKQAILDRIHAAEIYGQDTSNLEDPLSYITLL